jgi:hypothetical protein
MKSDIDNAVLLNSKSKLEQSIARCFLILFEYASISINVNTVETTGGVAEIFFDVKNLTTDSIISIWSKFLLITPYSLIQFAVSLISICR